MRYEPGANVPTQRRENTDGHTPHPLVSHTQPEGPDEAMSRQTAELDDWEDDGGSTVGQTPEPLYWRPIRRVFDEFSG